MKHSHVRAILAGSVPNLAQWFNLYLYATFAPYFRTEFFDADSPNSLIYVYGLFALTFVVRPFGSWLFGRLADSKGRQLALIVAVTTMSAGSIALALTPTAHAIGPWAAVILTGVSILQGIATGGEYGAATVLLSEAGTRGHRGFFASFQSATIVGGLVLAQACLIALVISSDRAAISEWGWRVAFAAGGAAGLASLWWARGLTHAEPAARARQADRASTLAALFRQHWRPLVWVFLLTAGGSAAFYTYTVTAPLIIRETFFAKDGAKGELTATAVVLAAFIVLMLLQPVGGALSDRIGRKPLLIAFGALGMVSTGVLLLVARSVTSAVAIFGTLAIAFVVLTCYLSVSGIAKAEVFPAHIRSLGVGFGYAVANSIFGGTAPLVYHATTADDSAGFIVYMTALVAVSLCAAIWMRGGVATPLDASDKPAEH
ncbi:MFS transporter, MHS family, alpha-ketoglutarate permease [Agreia bicolorata]|uniref:MFS transporter, MHS family, alpha-ketoglutarate permease n=1 Tax=Agreia bicolorata TaxID=110935 RepID=A0A1T4YLH6_9MICO|nr:MFS transporter [Agreia bicolorata]SKB02606.1 MFS transporter, MHS family, alpha-ketoglutarate permease [Agreia bicolorata]